MKPRAKLKHMASKKALRGTKKSKNASPGAGTKERRAAEPGLEERAAWLSRERPSELA